LTVGCMPLADVEPDLVLMLFCFKSLHEFLYANFNKWIIFIVVLLLSHQEALEIQLFGNIFGLQFQKQLRILSLSIVC